jgi:hypothetical protein
MLAVVADPVVWTLETLNVAPEGRPVTANVTGPVNPPDPVPVTPIVVDPPWTVEPLADEMVIETAGLPPVLPPDEQAWIMASAANIPECRRKEAVVMAFSRQDRID